MRLSYFDRVVPTLPEEFKAMLPSEPVPVYKFADGEEDGGVAAAAAAAAEMAIKVTELIQNRHSVEEIKSVLGGVSEDGEEGLDMTVKEVLIQSLLMVGSKSLSHMLAVVEKYLSLYQLLLPKQGDKTSANIFILDQLSSFWRNSMLHFEFSVERLINYRILLPNVVMEWIMERADEQLCDVENNFYNVISHTLGHGMILRTIQQAYMMPSTAATKMKGQSEEKIASTMANLQVEFEDCLAFALEKLASLKEQIVATEDTLRAVDGFCETVIKEIITVYPREVAKLASKILSISERKMSQQVKTLFKDIYNRPY